MKLLTFILLAIIITGCQPELDDNTQLNTTKSGAQEEEPDDKSKILLDQDLYNSSQSYDYRLDSAWIKADQLKLQVSYTGCEPGVDNWLISDGAYMESYPVQLRAKFVLDDPGDCDMAITEILSFDLSPLTEDYQKAYQQEKATIILQIKDYAESVKYDI